MTNKQVMVKYNGSKATVMKGCSKMAAKKVRDNIGLMMVVFTKETIRLTKEKGLVNMFGMKVMFMKGNGPTINSMVKASMFGKVVIGIKVSGLRISSMAKASICGKLGTGMMVNGVMIRNMVMGLCISLLEKFSKGFGKMIRKVAKEY